MRKFLASLALATVGVVSARTIDYTLDLRSRQVAPDGVPRSAVTLNGITPGPILTANKGDNLAVLVNNNLDDPDMRRSTSVHWHGILQPRTAYDDGPAFVTQCPIGPAFVNIVLVYGGSDASNDPSHSYKYSVALSDQAGTFWYHSHLSSQYVDGLRGALIVYDPEDPHQDLYDVDDESTVISLTDWYQKPANILGEAWLHNQGPIPVPDSNLFNGIGRYQGGPETPRAVVVVTRGKRYRFRIINMSAIVPFNFGIEGHQLTVIEADGINHEPRTVSSLSISAGQRYSVVLNADQPVANYWIAYPSNFNVTTIPSAPHYNGTEAFAILHYTGAPNKEPTTPQIVPDTSTALKEYQLVPRESPDTPTDTPIVVPLILKIENPGPVDKPGAGNNWTINGSQYRAPSVPTLLRILTGNATVPSDFPRSENTYVLLYNRTIDVQLIGGPDHPFHLHGHTFQVIQSADGPRNEVNPPIRDTVNTGGPNPVTIRFRTDNPGPWFLHCHKDWHLEAGMGVVFAEAPEEQRKTLHPPAEWQELCNIYNELPADQK